ncbi:hypothetical protein [Jiangella asiatica]|uniref:Uncharacterized protein n=1 Tax=Jiangella asiatica TaxID=2530372 RepID=A0A4R5CIQ9_9ACTN|nr:hypothetical protein [Jiangella asiatica]TDE00139.1 hypothetical protein E1269_26325 [Jiangella asiatica]
MIAAKRAELAEQGAPVLDHDAACDPAPADLRGLVDADGNDLTGDNVAVFGRGYRLPHHANVVITDGESYRIRQARTKGATIQTRKLINLRGGDFYSAPTGTTTWPSATRRGSQPWIGDRYLAGGGVSQVATERAAAATSADPTP